MKPGLQTSEFLAAIASMVAAVAPVIADKVPGGSAAAVILGAIAAAATYIAGRSYVKGKAIEFDCLRSAMDITRKPE